MESDSCLFQGFSDDGENIFRVVFCCFTREEACARRSHKCLSRIGKDAATKVHDTNSNLVGAALYAEHEFAFKLLYWKLPLVHHLI